MWGIFRTYINAGGNTRAFPPFWLPCSAPLDSAIVQRETAWTKTTGPNFYVGLLL